ncbi:MAG: WG repeat-containing protein, partial [Candidatus Brocadiia bacterium]
FGAIDAKGKYVIPPEYGSLEHIGEGLLVYSLRPNTEAHGLMDTSGRIVSEQTFRLHSAMHEGRMAAVLDRLWGFIDSGGKWVVPPAYKDVIEFSEGLAAVQVKDDYGTRWGYVDREGRMAIPPRFFTAGDFSEGRALVSEGGRHGYIDRDGHVVIALKYKSGSDFAGGFAEVETEHGSCRVDAEGNETPLPSIRLGDKVSNGRIADDRGAEFGKSFGVVDFSGKWLIQPQFSELHTEDGTYPLTGRKDWMPCFVNEQGEVTFVDAKSLEPFRCGYARCFVPGEGTRFIDRTGRVAFTWPFEMRDFVEVPLPRRAAGEAK